MSTGRILQLSQEQDIDQRLNAALTFAKDVCVLGSDNRIEDLRQTGGWVFKQKYRYSPGKYVRYTADLDKDDLYANLKLSTAEEKDSFKEDLNKQWEKDKQGWYYHVENMEKVERVHTHALHSKTDFKPLTSLETKDEFDIDRNKTSLLRQALRAMECRFGNCEPKSALVSDYLWRKNLGINRIECVAMNGADHVFVIVNREDGSTLNDPDTWGKAWVIDAWYKDGLIFPATEFRDRIIDIKNYVDYQQITLSKITFPASLEDSSQENANETKAETQKSPFDEKKPLGDVLWDIHPKGRDLLLMSWDGEKAPSKETLPDDLKKKAEDAKTPILIRVKDDEFYIYGCPNEGEKWKLKKIKLSDDITVHLKSLPFDKSILHRSDHRFNDLLIKTLEQVHDYKSDTYPTNAEKRNIGDYYSYVYLPDELRSSLDQDKKAHQEKFNPALEDISEGRFFKNKEHKAAVTNVVVSNDKQLSNESSNASESDKSVTHKKSGAA